MYDISEELITGSAEDSPLAALSDEERVQINVRRIPLAWLGTHVLYVEEYPYDEPFERRRRVLLSIEPPEQDGTLRVRQFTRKTGAAGASHADRGRRRDRSGLRSFPETRRLSVPRRHAQSAVRGA